MVLFQALFTIRSFLPPFIQLQPRQQHERATDADPDGQPNYETSRGGGTPQQKSAVVRAEAAQHQKEGVQGTGTRHVNAGERSETHGRNTKVRRDLRTVRLQKETGKTVDIARGFR